MSNPYLFFYKDHVVALDKLISKLSVQILQEYFVIKTVLQKLDSLKFPEPDKFIAPDTKDYPDLSSEELCARETSKSFKHIVSRFFVLSTLGGSKEKKKVDDMADMIHLTWIEDASKTNWIDDITKDRLLEKVIHTIRFFKTYILITYI